jgi:Poly(ADP-ribose) polymerase catalytic domain
VSNLRSPGEGFVLLCEVALGDMQRVYQPSQLSKPTIYHHSVYGVGQLKPKLIGIKDINRPDSNFLPSEMTVCSPEALFFNTGKLGTN